MCSPPVSSNKDTKKDLDILLKLTTQVVDIFSERKVSNSSGQV